jgi:flagellar biosynthesis protein FlhB
MSDKSEAPTPRRLRKAREQGDAPISHALGQSIGFFPALLLAPAAIAAAFARVAELLTATLRDGQSPLTSTAIAIEVLVLSAPLLLAVALSTALVGAAQTQGMLSPTRLAPRFERLDPVQGAKNLLSRERVFSAFRALLSAAFVAWFSFSLWRSHAADLANMAGNAEAIPAFAGQIARKLGVYAGFVGLALGAVDLLLVFQAWQRRHRMSKDEVRREHRESEGNPEVKAQRRRAHQEALTGALLNAVKDATVVIVNPTHFATALRYAAESEESAPRVVAQGQGELARRIIDAARAYGVPCVRDVPVARALAELSVGDEIPESLYEAVAEILRELGGPAEGDAGQL